MRNMSNGQDLEEVDQTFHEAYGRRRDEAAHGAPVFVVIGDELTLARRGGRRAHRFVPPESHLLKAAAHAPVGLYALLAAEDRSRLAAFVSRIERALTETAFDDVREVLEPTLTFARDAQAALPSREARREFARARGPGLYRLTEHATRLQLDSLHAIVDAIMLDFDAREEAESRAVVAGDHQARRRNLGMQYFEKRLPRKNAPAERVIYGEGISTVDDALALVGTQRFDVELATAFFGDPARLQEDVLGDAVAERLARMKVG